MLTTYLLWPFLQCIVLFCLIFVFINLISECEEAIVERDAIWVIATVASALAIYVFVGGLSEVAELRDEVAWMEREIRRCHLMHENV